MMPLLDRTLLALAASPAAILTAKVTLIAGLAIAVTRLVSHSRAAVRHALLAAAFGVILLLPLASFFAPPLRIAVASRPAETVAPPSTGPAPALPKTGRRSAPALDRAPAASAPNLLAAIWAAGSLVTLLPLLIGIMQVRKLRRAALPWRQGQALTDRLARELGIRRRVTLLLHESLSGPMTCGALSPAILLPPDAESWHTDDLDRALIHELEHVRRCDWLMQALARAVCSLYWFHPLVWMAWRRLALEAERACDDAVLRRAEATAYADQLVGLARRLSAPSKAPLLAMANRADLAARVGSVLDARQHRGRVGWRLSALTAVAAAGLLLALSPVKIVTAQEKLPAFEAVSVKLLETGNTGEHTHETQDPIRLDMSASLHRFIVQAYGISEAQLTGEPTWFRSNIYSIEAVAAAATPNAQKMLMLRGALADRFHLKLREEERDMPVYALEVTTGGPKFHELKPGERPKDPQEADGQFARTFVTIQSLVNSLNSVFGGILRADRPVVDRTNLTGRYDMELHTAMESEIDGEGKRTVSFPDLARDMQSQLGLRLTAERVKMPYYTVESASLPSAN